MNTLILVSGGDAPGINTAIARFTRLATDDQHTVYGVSHALTGLLNGVESSTVYPLDPLQVAAFESLAGSMLPSSREPVLEQPDARERIKATLTNLKIDSVLMFGGDGSLKHVLPVFVEMGLPCVGLPTTIDNDVPGTERTLGFDSACNYAYHAIDGVRATARALPGRVFMVETLGGHTGFIALDVAYGADADAVLIPEIPYENDWLADRLRDAIDRRGHTLLVISEGIPAARELALKIPEWIGIRMRDVRLGHAQRGATPTHIDRSLARRMVEVAYDAFKTGQSGVTIVRDEVVSLHPGTLADLAPRSPDRTRYDLVNGHNA